MSDGFVIVVEGCDKTGKTSLSRELESATGWSVVKTSQPKTPGPDAATMEYLETLATHRGPFIADRFHVGESVYGPIYRKTLPIGPTNLRLIEDKLLDRGCLLVLMEDDPDAIIKRFRKHNEDFAKEQDVRDIVQKYVVEWRRSHLAKIRASWTAALLVRTVVDVALAMGAKL